MSTGLNARGKLKRDKRQRRGGKKDRKHGRNRAKCERYRHRVGRPNGPGVSGNKAGKNRIG